MTESDDALRVAREEMKEQADGEGKG